MQTPEKIGFWNKLDSDIDNIGLRAKENLRKFQQKQYQTLRVKQTKPYELYKPTKNPQIFKDNLSDHSSIGKKDLVKMQKQQQHKQQMIRNRLVYLRNDRSKQGKTIEIAKKKFQNLVTIRNQSFKEKQAIRKRRMSLLQQSDCQIQSRVKIVHTARQHKKQSIDKWQRGIKSNASEIRFESANNQQLINKHKQFYKHDNIEKANKTKADLQRSRSIISQISQRKREYCRQGYMMQLNGKFKTLSCKKKQNEKLIAKLNQQAEKIRKWKQKANQQMNSYQSILKVKKNHVNMSTERSLPHDNSVKSFYLTHS